MTLFPRRRRRAERFQAELSSHGMPVEPTDPRRVKHWKKYSLGAVTRERSSVVRGLRLEDVDE